MVFFTAETLRLLENQDSRWRHKFALRCAGIVLSFIALVTMVVQIITSVFWGGSIVLIFLLLPIIFTATMNGIAISRYRSFTPSLKAGAAITLEVLAMLGWMAFVILGGFEMQIIHARMEWCAQPIRYTWQGAECNYTWLQFGGAAWIVVFIVSTVSTIMHVYLLTVGIIDRKALRVSIVTKEVC